VLVVRGKAKVLGMRPVSSATFSTTNPIFIGQVSNPGLGVGEVGN
jgi:hypothetical protein